MSGALEIVGSPSTGRIQSPAAQSTAPTSLPDSSRPIPATPFKTVNIIQDPSAGFITEYISAHGGEVITQVPSAITVAYLRQGLSADGMVKRSSEPKSVVTTV